MSSRIHTAVEIESFKRRAKKLRKRENITHVQALDRIAEEQGYRSWWHLQHAAALASNSQTGPTAADAAVDLVRFSVDPKDTADLDLDDLELKGVVEDSDFLEYLMEQEPEEPWELATWEQVFRFTKWTSADVREVIEKVRGHFYFPPRRIWVGGKEYDIEAYAAPGMITLKL